MKTDLPIRKAWTLKSEDATMGDSGVLTGAAAVMGNLDSADDVIFPGAFTPALAGFRKDGLVLVGHDWDDLPVAMPTLAEERGNILYTEATFHSTDEGQTARTVCSERLANGLSVGLSVGFFTQPEGYQIFESGQKLLDFAQANGYSLSMFDVPGIKAHKGWCRAILAIKMLVEYSIVPIPANPKAQAMSAKSWQAGESTEPFSVRQLEAILRELGCTRSEANRKIAELKSSLRDAGQSKADEGQTPPQEATEPPGVTDPNPAPQNEAHDQAVRELMARTMRARARAAGATT
jgi:HK97 family phage prohead protease